MFLMMLALVLAGAVAGALTTVAGLGGGILLVAGLGLVYPPALVLALTAPALFIGNASRLAMLRHEVDWPVVARFAMLAVPLAFAASLVAISAPPTWLQLILGVFLIAFAGHEWRQGPRTETTPGPAWLAGVAGGVAGGVSGLVGGAGFLAVPLLERLGLTPVRLVATTAAGMALIHLSKGVGLAAGAVLTPALWPAATALALGVVAGNACGARVLRRLPRAVFRRCLLGALALAGCQLIGVSIWSWSAAVALNALTELKQGTRQLEANGAYNSFTFAPPLWRT